MGEGRASPAISEAFARAVEALTAPEVSYALVGGLAVSFYGIPRSTRDIDAIVSAPRIRWARLFERLAEMGFSVDLAGAIRQLSEDHVVTLRYGDVPLDLMDAVLPLFRRIAEGAVEATVEGRRVRVAAAEDLIALKLLAGRERDVADVRGILAVSGDRLDLDRARRELEGCGAEEALSLLERLAKEGWTGV